MKEIYYIITGIDGVKQRIHCLDFSGDFSKVEAIETTETLTMEEVKKKYPNYPLTLKKETIK